MHFQYYQSPIGEVLVSASDHSLRQIAFVEDEAHPKANPNEVTQYVVRQLSAYFKHQEPDKIIHLVKKGSQFQRRVWEMVSHIPAGKTTSYQQIAIELGGINQTRAVARALATNPILLLIPCHRVTGKDGQLRGYAGSMSRKHWLLLFETKQVEQLTLFPVW